MKAVSETFLMSGSVMSRERSCLSLRRVLRNASHGSALGRTASSFRQHQEPCLGASISAIVKVFRLPAVTNIPHGQRPASENLQGTKPWEGARIRRCPGAHYGDYMSVGEPQLSQPRGSIER